MAYSKWKTSDWYVFQHDEGEETDAPRLNIWLSVRVAPDGTDLSTWPRACLSVDEARAGLENGLETVLPVEYHRSSLSNGLLRKRDIYDELADYINKWLADVAEKEPHE